MKTTRFIRHTVFAIGLAAGLLSAAVAGDRAASAQSADLFNNFNSDGVMNQPRNPTSFGVQGGLTSGGAQIEWLQTYHWNNGLGTAAPGTISLMRHDGQTFGPFQATGIDGQGGVPNANWVAQPNVFVPSGYYIVIDSDPATWSHNDKSGNRGFAIVRGTNVPAQPAPPPPQPTPTPQPAGKPVPVPPGPPQIQPVQCAGGAPVLPPVEPAVKSVYLAWINPCTFALAEQQCRTRGLPGAVLLATGYEYIGNKAYPQILVGCRIA